MKWVSKTSYITAEIRLNEPSASSTFENTWGNVYTSLKNARVIIGQCQEGKRDEGNLCDERYR